MLKVEVPDEMHHKTGEQNFLFNDGDASVWYLSNNQFELNYQCVYKHLPSLFQPTVGLK